MEHYCASIIDNRKITAAQIQSAELLQFHNEIGYQQAYQTIQAVLTKMCSDEAESFAKFPALAKRFMAADEYNYCNIAYHEDTHYFQAAFFAPGGIRRVRKGIRSFISINGTYTSSRF
jgi:hypothetical protein